MDDRVLERMQRLDARLRALREVKEVTIDAGAARVTLTLDELAVLEADDRLALARALCWDEVMEYAAGRLLWQADMDHEARDHGLRVDAAAMVDDAVAHLRREMEALRAERDELRRRWERVVSWVRGHYAVALVADELLRKLRGGE